MEISLAVLILCALSGEVWPAERVSQPQVHSASRVIGGQSSDHKDYPFLVSIQTLDKVWVHFCGGSILTPKAVLTACHCLVVSRKPIKLDDPHITRVVAGIGNLRRTSAFRQVRNAAKFVLHPDCGRPGTDEGEGDAGVIELEKPLSYNLVVQPLKVFSKDANTAVKELHKLKHSRTQCYSPGWGKVSQEPEKWAIDLRVAEVRLMGSKQCRNILCPWSKTFCIDFDADKETCAVSEDASVCIGDSGGPLVCKGYIYGVISRGPGCYLGIPQVYTNIDPLLYFVNKYA